jgi:hypothetical protein
MSRSSQGEPSGRVVDKQKVYLLIQENHGTSLDYRG